MADKLVKESCNLPTSSTSTLTYLGLYSLKMSQNLIEGRECSTHHWYASNRPGLALALKCDRCSQTRLSCFSSGHIKFLSFSEIKNTFSVCTRCQDHQASPEHVMRCMDLTSKDIYTDPLFVLDFFRANDLIDLVCSSDPER
ncbi:uncharacterized protein TNCV_2706691 [Trichonephila clavipes]|nr:uncharacterized protein TNCV_2706691 [Trichonephila clavipes]